MLSESGEPREMVVFSGPQLGDDWSKMTQIPDWSESRHSQLCQGSQVRAAFLTLQTGIAKNCMVCGRRKSPKELVTSL